MGWPRFAIVKVFWYPLCWWLGKYYTLENLGKFKRNSMTSWGLEAGAFRLVAKRLNHLSYRVLTPNHQPPPLPPGIQTGMGSLPVVCQPV
jgi:hypothetical protein